MATIRRLAIVGVGLIGGSIGLAAKATGIAAHVIGIDPRADDWPIALQRGVVNEITDDLATGLRDADMVVLAAPVEVIVSLLPRLAPLLSPDAIVTDAGSVKGMIAMAGAEALGPRFVASHPMSGSEQGGVRAARTDLFTDATWAITPTETTAERTIQQVTAFVSALGASPMVLSPQAHDEAVALTSHVPHVIAYALCAMAGNKIQRGDTELLRLAAGSWASATRVAESSPALWHGIAHQNREAVAASLEELVTILSQTAEQLRRSNDTTAVYELFAQGHAVKQEERTSSKP